jgi:hypothetical protein
LLSRHDSTRIEGGGTPNAEETEGPSYLTERPIETPDQDLFGRTAFAKEMCAYVVRAHLGTTGRVLGITGPWGAGKTSVLNLIANELEGRSEWSVVRFNPWAVTGLEALLRDFFQTLSTAFSDRDNYDDLRRLLARYADAVSPWAGAIKTPLIDPAKAVEALRQSLNAAQTVGELHAAVGRLIDKSSKRTLLMIDDVDRLQSDELLLMFKLVRLVGSLPKLDYLLAFDEGSVVTALRQSSHDARQARSYLDKVVPTRFQLPPAHPKYVDSLFNAYVGSWLTEAALTLYPDDTNRLSAAYYAWMMPRLSIPRNLKALFSEAGPPMALLGPDANPVDVLLLVYLRHFAPGLFGALPAWKAELTRSAVLGIPRQLTRDERGQAWRRRLTSVGLAGSDVEPALVFLAQLFLPLKGVVESADAFTNETWQGLDRDRRVGSARYFDRYFDQGLAPGEVPDSAIDAAIATIQSDVGAGIESLTGLLRRDPDQVLNRLSLLRREVSSSDQLRLLTVLALAHAELPDAGLFALSPMRRAEHWSADVIVQAANEDTPLADVLEPLLSARPGLRMLLSAVDIALAQLKQNKHAVPERLEELRRSVLTAVVTELESIQHSGVAALAGDNLLWFLYSWCRIDSTQAMQDWVAKRLEAGDWNVLDIAALCVPIATSFGTGAAPRQVLGDFLVDEFDGLVNWQRARNLLKPISGLPDVAVDRQVVSFGNRREIAAAALRRRLAEDQFKRQPGPNLIRELLNANSRAYMTVGVEAVPYDPSELSDHALDLAEALAKRLNKDAIPQAATSTAAWWQVGDAGSTSWMFWMYPGPTLVVKSVAPLVTSEDGAPAFSMSEIVSWWKLQIAALGSTMRELGNNEVRWGLSLQSLPSGAPPIATLEFRPVANPGRRARPHQIAPWSQMLEPAPADQIPSDFEMALRTLIKQFQYKAIETTAEALARMT